MLYGKYSGQELTVDGVDYLIMGFAPTLGRSIAFARVAPDAGMDCKVDIRGRLESG